MDDEQQGCFNPVIMAPVIGAGCAVLVAVLVVVSLLVAIIAYA